MVEDDTIVNGEPGTRLSCPMYADDLPSSHGTTAVSESVMDDRKGFRTHWKKKDYLVLYSFKPAQTWT